MIWFGSQTPVTWSKATADESIPSFGVKQLQNLNRWAIITVWQRYIADTDTGLVIVVVVVQMKANFSDNYDSVRSVIFHRFMFI